MSILFQKFAINLIDVIYLNCFRALRDFYAGPDSLLFRLIKNIQG